MEDEEKGGEDWKMDDSKRKREEGQDGGELSLEAMQLLPGCFPRPVLYRQKQMDNQQSSLLTKAKCIKKSPFKAFLTAFPTRL